jgi:hypothetical protein
VSLAHLHGSRAGTSRSFRLRNPAPTRRPLLPAAGKRSKKLDVDQFDSGSAIDIRISGDWKTARSQFPASHATIRAVVARSRPKFGQPYAALARALPSIG